jgi:PKD domain
MRLESGLSVSELNAFKNTCEISPQNGLVAYWKFNEGSGTTANDFSGSNLPLTIFNGTWTTRANQGYTGNWDFGDLNSATGFNATHIYTNAATYNAQFVLTDLNGCASNTSVPVTIQPNGTWLGANANWSDAVNWCGGVPTAVSDVKINGAVVLQPALSQTSFCNHIEFSNNAMIDLLSEELVINGEVSGSGKFNSTASATLSFEGSGDAGTIYFNQTNNTTHSLWDLNINKNGGTLTLGDSLWIYNTLTLQDGNLITNNYLRLKTIHIPGVFTNTARIAPVGTGAAIIGNITAEQFAPGGLTGWALLGSPVIGATISDWTSPWPSGGFPTSGFTGATGTAGSFISIYGYDETVAGAYDTGYQPATNITNPLTNGKGLYTYLGTGAVNTNDIYFSVYGAPQYGPVDFNVSYTNTIGGITADGWNLIANPYACDIDWLSNDWTKNNIDDAIYIYNADYGNMSSYVAGIGTNGGSQYIAAHQGFFVKANSAAPQLVSDENIKVLTNTTLLRSSSSANDAALLRLKVTQQGNLLNDEMVVRFNDGALQNYDGTLEAYKVLPQQADGVYIMAAESYGDLSISALPTLLWTTLIPIKVNIQGNGVYTLHITAIESIMLAYPDLFLNNFLVIENVQNGQVTPLNASMDYSFIVNDGATTANFVIRFNDQTMGIENLNTMFNHVNCFYQQDGYVVDAHFAKQTNLEIQVLNTLGQMVLPVTKDQIKDGKYMVATQELAEGIYFIKVLTPQKEYVFKVKGR